MSRSILYLTVAVLAMMVGVLSYTLRKQTDPPPPPTPQDSKEMQARQQEMMKTQMKQQMAMQQKEMAMHAKLGAKLKNFNPKKSPTSINISDKWFKEAPDGPAGIAEAEKERAAATTANASTPPAVPAPSGAK